MVQVLRTARPTARKAHRCDLCGGPINPGEVYDRQTSIYDARVYDWLTCPACAPVMTAVWAWLGSPWDEGVGTDDADEWAHEHPDDPLAVAYLARREAAHAAWLAQVEAADDEGGQE